MADTRASFAFAVRGMEEFAAQIRAVGAALEVDGRGFARLEREVLIRNRPGWLDDTPWHFPLWAVRSRPFDYLVDEADIPVPPPSPSWSVPERRQFDLYLRPAEAVVRR